MSILDKIFKSREIKQPRTPYVLNYGYNLPPDRNLQGYLQAYGEIGWLFAVVSRIAEGVSEAKWRLYSMNSKGERIPIYNHPILDAIDFTNPFQTWQEFIELHQIYMGLTGECFWIINKNRLGEPQELWIVSPERITIVPSKTDFISGYVYQIGNQKIPLNKSEVIHHKLPNPTNPYRGLGPVQALAIDLDSEMYAGKWNRNFFYNSARPDGLIMFEGTLSEEQFDRLKKQWGERHEGVSRAHKVGLLEGGGKYQQIQFNAKDMDFKGLRLLNRDNILGIYGMPLSVMGITENVNKANCYDSQTEYLTDNGWRLYEQVTNDDKIASYDDGYIKFEKPLNRYQYDYTGEMYHYTAKVTDLMVTPNHNLYYRTTEGDYRKTEAKDADYTRLIFKASCNWQGKDKLDIPFDIKLEDWLEFLGYFISEGGLSIKARNGHHYMFTLAQKDDAKAELIRSCLSRLPFKYTEYGEEYYRWNVYGKELHQYLLNTIGAYCEDKQIPKDIKALNPELLRILFDALMLGDGSWDKRDGRTNGYYATVSKQLADDVMEIALKLGYRVSCKPHTDKRPNRQVVYFVHLSELKEVEVQQSNDGINIEQYNGKVSCFEVSSHLLITRRNGFVSIQGNSEAGEYTFARWIVKPRLNRIKHKLNEQLIPMFKNAKALELDFDEVVPQTLEQKQLLAESGIRAGYMTINEARQLQGLKPLSDNVGAVLLTPLNLIPTSIKLFRKAKIFSSEWKETFWRGYVARAEAYERKLIINLKKMFNNQEAEAIGKFEAGNKDLINLLEAKTEYIRIATPILTDLLNQSFRNGLELINPKPPHRQIDEEYPMNADALRWLKTRIGWAAEQVNEETMSLLSKALIAGYEAGEDIPTIAKRIREVFADCDRRRSILIARTETISASAHGAIEGYKEAGVDQVEFYAAIDERTCPDCDNMHGEIFNVGDSIGIIPLHPDCRCTWLPVIGG